MKITKAMGRACLLELETGDVSFSSNAAIEELGFSERFNGKYQVFSGSPFVDNPEVQTALAMCAAIAGVRP